jgi:hypothetical protein
MNRLLILPLMGLAACSSDPHVVLTPDFGNAVASNIAVQLDNPAPNTDTSVHTSDGRRIYDAIQRYRTGHIYPPVAALEPIVKEGKAPVQPAPNTPDGQ